MAIKSLADRIREQKKKNVSAEEQEAEKKIVKRITVSQKTRKSLPDKIKEKDNLAERWETLTQTLNRTDTQSNSRTVGQTVGHTDTQTDGQTVGHSDKHSPKRIDDLFEGLSDRQKIILAYLANQENSVVSVKDMEADLCIPYGTIRGSIRVLAEKKFISKPIRYRNGKYQGIKYRISQNTRTLSQTLCQTLDNGHSDTQTDSQTLSLYSSSSLYNKTTTMPIQKILNSDPELTFWKQQGVDDHVIRKWMTEFNFPLDKIFDSMNWCRFLIVEQKIEIQKSATDYLYGWFKKGGGTKPKGYKSFAEIERETIEQYEQRLKEIESLRQRRLQVQRDIEFQGIMNDPESELYQRCFDSLNDFQKKNTTGKGFEMSMRSFFDKFMEES